MLIKSRKAVSILSIAIASAFGAAYASADTVAVKASDDTFVVGGENANDNHAFDTVLRVKNANEGGAHREALMRFSLSGYGVTFPVQSATLKLRLKTGNSDVDKGKVTSTLTLIDPDWDEQDVTFNNKPNYYSQITTFVPPATSHTNFELDVTDALNNWGAEKVAFAVENITKGYKTDWNIFSSDDGELYAPELVVVHDAAPACTTYTADRTDEELLLGSAGCITVPSGMNIKEVIVEDSDEVSCNIRGVASDSDGRTQAINSDTVVITTFRGTTLNIDVSNGCNNLKLTVRPQ